MVYKIKLREDYVEDILRETQNQAESVHKVSLIQNEKPESAVPVIQQQRSSMIKMLNQKQKTSSQNQIDLIEIGQPVPL